MTISVVFEGVEGAGKTSLSLLLHELLEKVSPYPVIHVREPDGTPLGAAIRHILLNSKEFKDMDPASRTLLYGAARNELLKKVIYPFERENPNGIIVGDRTWPSTLALQTSDGDSYEYTYVVNKTFIDSYPTRVLYVDIPPEEIVARLKLARENGREINWRDQQTVEKYIRERNNYLGLVRIFEGRFVLVNGLGDLWDTTIEAAYFVFEQFPETDQICEAKNRLAKEGDELRGFLKGRLRMDSIKRLDEIRKELGIPDKADLTREMINDWRNLGFLETQSKGIERI